MMKAARKPSARQLRKQRAAHAVAQRTSRQVDLCAICQEGVIGPALRTAERRLGRFLPCGCEKLCWNCAYNYAMRSSLYRADNQPILNEDDLESTAVHCPGCNSVATAFEECTPAGTILAVAALPFRDLSAQQRHTLRHALSRGMLRGTSSGTSSGTRSDCETPFAWVNRGGRQMQLGTFAEEFAEEVALCVARSPEGRVAAAE